MAWRFYQKTRAFLSVTTPSLGGVPQHRLPVVFHLDRILGDHLVPEDACSTH